MDKVKVLALVALLFAPCNSYSQRNIPVKSKTQAFNYWYVGCINGVIRYHAFIKNLKFDTVKYQKRFSSTRDRYIGYCSDLTAFKYETAERNMHRAYGADEFTMNGCATSLDVAENLIFKSKKRWLKNRKRKSFLAMDCVYASDKAYSLIQANHDAMITLEVINYFNRKKSGWRRFLK